MRSYIFLALLGLAAPAFAADPSPVRQSTPPSWAHVGAALRNANATRAARQQIAERQARAEKEAAERALFERRASELGGHLPTLFSADVNVAVMAAPKQTLKLAVNARDGVELELKGGKSAYLRVAPTNGAVARSLFYRQRVVNLGLSSVDSLHAQYQAPNLARLFPELTEESLRATLHNLAQQQMAAMP